MRLVRIALPAIALLATSSALMAQGTPALGGPCATPDSVAFRGQNRIPESQLRADVGIAPKSAVNSRVLTRALRDLYATNQFEATKLRTFCDSIGGKAVLIFE